MKKLARKGNMNQRIDVVLRKFRSRLNSYPPGMCPLVLYRSLLQISINQSCGKCIPCRDGLVEADRLLGKILNGGGTAQTLQELQDLCQIDRCDRGLRRGHHSRQHRAGQPEGI